MRLSAPQGSLAHRLVEGLVGRRRAVDPTMTVGPRGDVVISLPLCDLPVGGSRMGAASLPSGGMRGKQPQRRAHEPDRCPTTRWYGRPAVGRKGRRSRRRCMPRRSAPRGGRPPCGGEPRRARPRAAGPRNQPNDRGKSHNKSENAPRRIPAAAPGIRAGRRRENRDRVSAGRPQAADRTGGRSPPGPPSPRPGSGSR